MMKGRFIEHRSSIIDHLTLNGGMQRHVAARRAGVRILTEGNEGNEGGTK
ncbi:MAG TPA: hypothetical protein VM680_18630 [Verrucomicrobiae bacterium]|nr:hypothetical protein [Verrucomicrobiae bacterium]